MRLCVCLSGREKLSGAIISLLAVMKQEEAEVEVEKGPKMKRRKYLVEDVVTKSANKIEPLLVDFANGQPLHGADLRGTLHRVSDKHGVHAKNSLLTVQTPILSYTGTETRTRQPGSVNTFLGLLDKATGRIRLVEASQYTVQPVIQKLASTVTGRGLPDTATYNEKQEAIAAAFGSRKAKQQVARRRQNQVEAETMSGAIDHAAAVAVDSSEAVGRHLEQQEETSLVGILPPCNREASRVEDVYCLQDLAPDDFLAHMEESATAILTAQQELDPKSTLLFREMVENAKHESKFGDQLRLCCVALLVNHLLAFLTCRGNLLRDFEKGHLMDGCCRRVAVWVVQEYTQKQGSLLTRTQKDEDRALCLLLILAFISNKYELPVSTLLQSVPIKKERLNLLMRVIGATYKATTHSFQLKLPLAKLTQNVKKIRGTKSR